MGTTEDMLALQQLQARYGHVMDDRDWDALDTVFADDAVVDFQPFGLPRMEGLEALAIDAGARIARLDAQTRVIGFYESLGYFAYGDLHLDANILHRWMDKALIEDEPVRR